MQLFTKARRGKGNERVQQQTNTRLTPRLQHNSNTTQQEKPTRPTLQSPLPQHAQDKITPRQITTQRHQPRRTLLRVQGPTYTHPPQLPTNHNPQRRPTQRRRAPRERLQQDSFKIRSPSHHTLYLQVQQQTRLHRKLFPQQPQESHHTSNHHHQSKSRVTQHRFQHKGIRFPTIPSSQPSYFDPHSLQTKTFFQHK